MYRKCTRREAAAPAAGNTTGRPLSSSVPIKINDCLNRDGSLGSSISARMRMHIYVYQVVSSCNCMYILYTYIYRSRYGWIFVDMESRVIT